MAFINNPNSWNGGTAVFNANPITETYLKLAAHREAKNQAFDQYHQKQLESIDRDGVRDVDAPDFQKKVQEWNTDWQMNKDKLKKGDIQSQIQNDKKYNELRTFINQSKARDAAKKDALTVGSTLKKENGTLPDDFLKDLDYNDRPINDSEVDESDKQIKSRRINPVKYLVETAPWDVAKGMKQYDHLPTNKVTTFGETNPETGMHTSTTTEQFGNESKQAIAAIAGSNYQNDPSFTKAVKTAVANPETKAHLEQVYQEQMGKMPEHPEEYATALILAQKAAGKVEQKDEVDKVWQEKRKNDQAIAMEKMRQNGRIGLEGIKQNNRQKIAEFKNNLKKATPDEQDNALNVIYKGIQDESEKPGNTWQIKRNGNVVSEYKVAHVPQAVKKLFGVDTVGDDGKKVQNYPTHFGFNKDGTVQVLFSSGDKDGKFAVDKKLSNTITQGEFKALLRKGLGIGTKTGDAADFEIGDDNTEEDEDGEDIHVPAGQPLEKPKSSKKKIPGF